MFASFSGLPNKVVAVSKERAKSVKHDKDTPKGGSV
jgi:hypothetical protein